MKKTLLIIFCIMLCSLSWAQSNQAAEAAKNKAQNPPAIARVQENATKNVVVYPNPSNGIIHLTLAGFKGKRTDLRIMNVIGNVVHREFISEPEDRFTKTLDLSRFANGLYYVKLQSEDYSEIRKVIIN